ncbi:M48 family metalloprotease [Sphaerisporangium sp. NPDC004334]
MTLAPPRFAEAPEDVADLPGLAKLICALRHSARLPGLLVHITPELEDNAEALAVRCDRTPRIDLGTGLLGEGDALYGVLAHEIAHHALGHGVAAPFWRRPSWWARAALLAGLIVHLPVLLLGVLGCLVVAVHAAGVRRARLEEFDADFHAVLLLDAAGLPGRRLMAAALADLIDLPAGYRLIGWLLDDHPSAKARRRLLATGRRARRLRWALLWQRTHAPAPARGVSCSSCGLSHPPGTRGGAR